MHDIKFIELRKLPDSANSVGRDIKSLLVMLEDVLSQVRANNTELVFFHLFIHEVEINLSLVVLELALYDLFDFLSIGRLKQTLDRWLLHPDQPLFLFFLLPNDKSFLVFK